MKSCSLIARRLAAIAAACAMVQVPAAAEDAKLSCPAYKVDLLKFVKPGLVIRVKGGTVGCLTPEAYDSFVKAIHPGNSARAADLASMRVCYTAPKEGATVKVIQIKPTFDGFCNMQTVLYPDRGLGASWIDVGMFDEVVVPP